ncbi:D-erythronate dehydrogenase [Plutella xylostella]|uniref:D-erythronate dehydrogenase n=1 Tax=Plutella xylostella TaxID=51655 RepID=UPI0020326B71|nr:D-erythronate dehydrogenase [Plutella xylostella]
MDIVVTGAGGYLGGLLADALLQPGCPVPVRRLLLLDVAPPPPRADPRVTCRAADLAAPGAPAALLPPGTQLVFHLAAVVSGHAEQDFELGLRVNLDVTRALLDAVRALGGARLVFASTVGVFGGALPAVVHEGVAPTPQSSYGCAKAMSELLVAEYARRGWLQARTLRLPTITVRAGAANRAVTSFASGMVREPLVGRDYTVPVPPETELWVASPRAAVRNLLHAAAAGGDAAPLCLPGLTVSAGAAAAALAAARPAAAARLRWAPDPLITAMVQSFPARFDCSRALRLGYVADESFDSIVRDYIQHDLKETSA